MRVKCAKCEGGGSSLFVKSHRLVRLFCQHVFKLKNRKSLLFGEALICSSADSALFGSNSLMFQGTEAP